MKMKLSDSISLTFPADSQYIPLAILAAKECARGIQFSEHDVSRICLAIEEGINHALEFGYGAPHDTLQINFSRIPLGLRMSIQFHGLPLEIEQLPKYDPARASQHGDITGISLLLIEKILDKTSFASLPKGIRTVSMEKYLPAQRVSDATEPHTTNLASDAGEYILRLARPDDAEAISRLAFQSHGTVLFNEHIYYPDHVREMIQAKEMISVVAETVDNPEVVGHGALLRYAPDALVEELTFGFVTPRFRGRRCASQFAQFLEKNARNRGIYAIESFAVTSHVHSQRALLSHGYKECGILLNYSPASHSWGEEDACEPGRIADLMLLKYLEKFRDVPLYIPDHHRRMVEKIYSHHGITLRIGTDPDDSIPPDSESHICTLSDFKEGWAVIKIIEYGSDSAAQIADRLTRACAQGLASIVLALPLANPATKTATATFEEMGFFFAGVGPDEEGNENLILQYVNTAKINLESIKVHSDFARTIVEYIRKCGSLSP